MLRSFEWFIAKRYLRTSWKEGVVAVMATFSFLGILLGVATLIVVMSVMNGFRQELISRIVGFNGHLMITREDGAPMEGYSQISQDLQKTNGVLFTAPFVQKQGLFTSAHQACGGIVQGLNREDLEKRPLIASHMVRGSLQSFGEPSTILLGKKLAHRLQVDLGEKVKITTPEMTVTAFGSFPKSRYFKVIGFFESGMYEYDSTFAFIPLADSQIFFAQPGGVSGIEVFVPDPENISSIEQKIRRLFPDLYVYNWQAANQKFFSTLQVQRNVMFLILMLIVLVAAFNIISCLIMLVKDKTRAISLLRAMGASSRSIMKIFLYVGCCIGVGGTLVGSALGLLFSYHIDTIRRWLEALSGTNLFREEIYFLSHLPSKVDINDAMIVIASALVISFLATLFPAYKASRLKPIEGLRYE